MYKYFMFLLKIIPLAKYVIYLLLHEFMIYLKNTTAITIITMICLKYCRVYHYETRIIKN